jgi:hypothetical protein
MKHNAPGRCTEVADVLQPGRTMNLLKRAGLGAEAGAIAAGGVAVFFFVFDLLRLDPLATPGALSGSTVGPGSISIDLTSLAGVAAALVTAADLAALTTVHLLTFSAAGAFAALLFDWGRGGGPTRGLAILGISAAAFYGTVVWSDVLGLLDTAGWGTMASIVLIAAVLLAGSLRIAFMPTPEDEVADGGAS